MRVRILWGIALTGVSTAVFAQPASQPAEGKPDDEYHLTRRAVKVGIPLRGAVRARYVCRQLGLTPEQHKQVWTMINTIFQQHLEELPIDALLALGAEMRQLKAKGDEKGVERVKEQMRRLMERYEPDEEFYTNLRELLTPEQRERLDEVLARLKRNPDGTLRPADVLRVARHLDLTEEQRQQLEEFKLHTARKFSIGRVVHDEVLRFKLMRRMIAGVRAILTPEQRARFDREVDALRPDLVPGIERMDELLEEMSATKRRGAKTGKRGKPKRPAEAQENGKSEPD